MSLNSNRHTVTKLRAHPHFVLNVPTSDMEAQVLQIGKCSGREVNKFQALSIPTCLPGWASRDTCEKSSSPSLIAIADAVCHIVCTVQVCEAETANRKLPNMLIDTSFGSMQFTCRPSKNATATCLPAHKCSRRGRTKATGTVSTSFHARRTWPLYFHSWARRSSFTCAWRLRPPFSLACSGRNVIGLAYPQARAARCTGGVPQRADQRSSCCADGGHRAREAKERGERTRDTAASRSAAALAPRWLTD